MARVQVRLGDLPDSKWQIGQGILTVDGLTRSELALDTLTEDGVSARLERFRITGLNSRDFQAALWVAPGGSRSGDNRRIDLNGFFEENNGAITVSNSHLAQIRLRSSFTIPGPNASNTQRKDSTERYAWRVRQANAWLLFITNFAILSASDVDDTVIVFNDGAPDVDPASVTPTGLTLSALSVSSPSPIPTILLRTTRVRMTFFRIRRRFGIDAVELPPGTPTPIGVTMGALSLTSPRINGSDELELTPTGPTLGAVTASRPQILKTVPVRALSINLSDPIASSPSIHAIQDISPTGITLSAITVQARLEVGVQASLGGIALSAATVQASISIQIVDPEELTPTGITMAAISSGRFDLDVANQLTPLGVTLSAITVQARLEGVVELTPNGITLSALSLPALGIDSIVDQPITVGMNGVTMAAPQASSPAPIRVNVLRPNTIGLSALTLSTPTITGVETLTITGITLAQLALPSLGIDTAVDQPITLGMTGVTMNAFAAAQLQADVAGVLSPNRVRVIALRLRSISASAEYPDPIELSATGITMAAAQASTPSPFAPIVFVNPSGIGMSAILSSGLGIDAISPDPEILSATGIAMRAMRSARYGAIANPVTLAPNGASIDSFTLPTLGIDAVSPMPVTVNADTVLMNALSVTSLVTLIPFTNISPTPITMAAIDTNSIAVRFISLITVNLNNVQMAGMSITALNVFKDGSENPNQLHPTEVQAFRIDLLDHDTVQVTSLPEGLYVGDRRGVQIVGRDILTTLIPTPGLIEYFDFALPMATIAQAQVSPHIYERVKLYLDHQGVYEPSYDSFDSRVDADSIYSVAGYETYFGRDD